MILASICCRGGSKGVPGKNIRLLKGKPLIAYTIEVANSTPSIDDLIISTDDEAIAEVAKQYGAKVPFMRPAELASDTASKWPVFIHAVEMYEKLTGKTVDYLVDLDVTVPLKSGIDIDGAIKMALADETVDVVITGYEPERNPYFNMVEIGNDGFAEIVKKGRSRLLEDRMLRKFTALHPLPTLLKKVPCTSTNTGVGQSAKSMQCPEKERLILTRKLILR